MTGQILLPVKSAQSWPVDRSWLVQYPALSYHRRDGGSRATDDLSRSKYGITDPPISQLARQA